MKPSIQVAALSTCLVPFALLFALDCSNRSGKSGVASANPSHAVAPSAVPAPLDAEVPPEALVTDDEKNTVEIFRVAAPSTVFVTQKRRVIDYFGAASELPSGSGSGFVWDATGHVVTNFHVVQKAEAITVTLQDHQTYDAKVVGVEPRKDIAVLKIDVPTGGLVPIRHAVRQAPLQVGQKTIAIGNPFGLDHTLTTGIISALGREVNGIGGVTIRDMVQTDAAINPGNSGGPLLDSRGHLIGMNTMIYSQSGGSAGIGFAVPASFILRVVPQIIKTGRAEQVGLGINIDPSQRLERQARLRGVVVLNVLANGPAEKAGLQGIRQSARGIQLGDIIVGIDQDTVKDFDDLYNALDKHKPGDVAEVRVHRDGKVIGLRIPLVALP